MRAVIVVWGRGIAVVVCGGVVKLRLSFFAAFEETTEHFGMSISSRDNKKEKRRNWCLWEERFGCFFKEDVQYVVIE